MTTTNGSIQEIRSSGLCSLDENSVKSQLGGAHVNAALGSSGGGQLASARMQGKPLRLSPRPRTQRSQSEYRSANSSSESISRARGNREHASAASVTSLAAELKREAALGSCGFSAIAKLGPRFQTSGRISRDTPAAGTSRYFRALLGLCQPESEDDWVQPRIERGLCCAGEEEGKLAPKPEAARMASKVTALHTAPSWESCDSQQMFEGPPSRKRKAPKTDSTLLVLKRMCDSPVEASDLSSYGSQTEQGWESPIKDIDLVASDSLEDEEAFCQQEPELGHTSSCSSAHSEEWAYQAGDLEGPLKSQGRSHLASPPSEPTNMSNSPTKSGDFLPRQLPAHCLVASTAYQYGFTPFVVSVGTTYFQRLAAADPALKKAARGCPDFAPFMDGIPVLPLKSTKSVGAPLHQCQTARHWLLAVHLTCIYVAAKNVEVVPYKHLLRTMLQRLHGLLVTPEQAEKLELEVLVALEWRLGPFFLHRDT